MKTQKFWDSFYMSLAHQVAAMSYAPDKKVGAVLVTQGGLVSLSYNDTIPGASNATVDEEGRTLPSVLHAEHNAIMKVCNTSLQTRGSTLYSTLSPCMECSKLIYSAGIARLVYYEPYKHGKESLDFLQQAGLLVNGAVPHCQYVPFEQLKHTGLLDV